MNMLKAFTGQQSMTQVPSLSYISRNASHALQTCMANAIIHQKVAQILLTVAAMSVLNTFGSLSEAQS